MNHYMNRVALNTFSYFCHACGECAGDTFSVDAGKKPSEESEPEKFYHGFVLGLLVDQAAGYVVKSNRESGFGRYDVVMEPKNGKDTAVIMEFKVLDDYDGEKELADTAKNARSCKGERITDMKNMIINGDSIDEMNKMEAESVDLIFADPPYWMRVDGVLKRVEGTDFDGCDDEWDQFESLDSYEAFTRKWLEACYRILKPDGSIWVIGGMQCIYTIGAIMQQIGFWFINDVVWHKKNPTPNFMGTRLNNSHETLIWAAKSKQSRFTFHYKTAKEFNLDTVSDEEFEKGSRKQLGSVWRIAVCSGNERLRDEEGSKLHSTQKPQEMLDRIVAISSSIGDLVLDPFGGTMTTGVAAKKMGRNYIMIERNATYCEYGKKRLDAVEFEDTPIARADFDQKSVKVSVPEMIRANALIENEWFYFRQGDAVARLMADGKLDYNGEILDMHSCAAKARGVKAKRLNGFDYWYVMRDESRVSISEIRDAYREAIQQTE